MDLDQEVSSNNKGYPQQTQTQSQPQPPGQIYSNNFDSKWNNNNNNNNLYSPLNIDDINIMELDPNTTINFNNYDTTNTNIEQFPHLSSQQDQYNINNLNQINPQITINMPGAYNNNNEGMEIDDSPPFTIESDLYFEPQINDNNSIITSTNPINNQEDSSLMKQQQQVHAFNQHQHSHSRSHSHSHSHLHLSHQQLTTPTQPIENHNSPFDDSSRVSSFQNISYQQAIPNSFFINGRDLYFDDHDSNFTRGRLRNGSIDSYYAANVIQNQLQQQQNQINHVQQPTQNQKFNELSPITTTTSRSSSIHSTQPSFFSAQQYLTRNSFDQQQTTNSSLHRPSIDIYNRPSMDSQQSQQQQRNPRYTSFTNSITNMLPFMGDSKNQQQQNQIQRSPSNVNSSLQQQNIQSRHLIRSIFKTNILNNEQQQQQNIPFDENDSTTLPSDLSHDEYLIMSPKEEEFGIENPTKKIKKSKRSLFTRFKSSNAPGKQEVDEIPLLDETKENESSIDGPTLSANGSSGAPSIMTNNQVQTQIEDEPDYAALFSNVGKRKNIVSTGYRKPKIKKEESSSFFKNKNSNKTDVGSDKSSFLDDVSGNNVSITSSQESSIIEEPTESSSIATTSKRLLGISKKKSSNKFKSEIDEFVDEDDLESKAVTIASLNTPVATMISKGVEIEVDLASLDLPPDTKIFPTSIINNKNRTRGRKENKEADAIDSSKIYLCNYCSRRFKRHEHLKRHFRSLHTFNKPFDCSICHKKFSRSDNLNQHLKIHKQEEENKKEEEL
ncbi:unnamed protein product [Candida verbasci]|uniref:C2H2-type domain-containing protein n=1 Tax=Candida verbasci TaxID=1227364 RepID=A0A9W4TRX0_9ASCO|nr:unnamed protein product [Candida verbasci]